MSKQIEELSKQLANGVPRRKAFYAFFAGMAGALFSARRADARNNICVEFCRYQAAEGRDFGQCVAASAKCPEGSCALVINGTRVICHPVF